MTAAYRACLESIVELLDSEITSGAPEPVTDHARGVSPDELNEAWPRAVADVIRMCQRSLARGAP